VASLWILKNIRKDEEEEAEKTKMIFEFISKILGNQPQDELFTGTTKSNTIPQNAILKRVEMAKVSSLFRLEEKIK